MYHSYISWCLLSYASFSPSTVMLTHKDWVDQINTVRGRVQCMDSVLVFQTPFGSTCLSGFKSFDSTGSFA
ncbi:hypothetical protein BP00DRAFT_426692 [Aspergillus indologenus CBS 114.80]|uniref:Uncharacterized protein n=1 Tax=Aspergillus indologenus CBS 114.80 TaxID=1450541 RepID=A0A2V5I581_9EURO|nr:hypothetical protein BP00DRAFT_426692 [Aspergillus indologenus CBS 114.80]